MVTNSSIIKNFFILFLIALSCVLLIPFALFGKSDSKGEAGASDYCISCHVMQAEYEAWMHSGAHRRKECVDCHLPNENKAVHYLWKSIDGVKDLIVFHSGKIPEQIKISSHGEKVLQSNCIRCHETTVMLMDQTRKCWNCHRRITHFHTGITETY
jgi:cytochrome c nitrite reductase small subunit